MRVTIQVDASELKQIQTLTGQKKKSPAISRALSEYIRQEQKRQFIERALSGRTDYTVTNEALEARDVYEAH